MYIPLNIKTDYSLLESTIKIKELVSYAKNNNIKALTITDYNMFGAMEFYQECINNNIKPIIGLNIIINELDVILYAKNYTGYVNLLKISTIDRLGELNVDTLITYKENLLCILPYESRSLYKDFSIIYNDIYVSYKNEEEKNKIKLTNKLYMNPILVLTKEDNIYLNYLKAIRENKLLKNDEYNYELKLNVEDNSYLYDLFDLKIEKNNNLLPKFDTKGLDTFTYLKNECKKGLKKRFGDKVGIKYIERLKYELDVINELNFNDYFLIVSDYVKYAKENNILVGPGRGSAVGSLVAYVLEITNVDPLKYGLLFERFLNKNRVTMPDIDIDFDGNRRIEVINYCKEKYGEKSVCGIITFVKMGAKQTLKEVGKCLDIDEEETDYLIRLLDSSLNLKQNLERENIKNHLHKNAHLKELYDISIKLEGTKKTTSVNASGIIICNEELDNYIPLEKRDDIYLSGYSMNYLEDIGLLKMDFLALKNLTTISNIVNEIGEIDLNDIPLNDEQTFEIFNSRNTLGIFQFETDGMRNVLTKFKIHSLEDIYNLSALFRPGPSANIDSYIRRKKGIEKVDYFHDDLINILKPTYGIIIYQEQIMQIANVLADYSLGEADILRRAMSKKKEDILKNERQKFIERAVNKGYELELVERIYDLILKFAEYGFNKSHAVAYAIISYQMAYLKANYPVYFFKNCLSSSLGAIKVMNLYISECRSMNVKLKNPNINVSKNDFILNDGIVFPLNSIKSVGDNVVKHILEIRNNGIFNDIYDFLIRTDSKIITKECIQNLVLAGCFDELITNRKTIIENLDIILNYTYLYKEFGSDYAFKPEIKVYEEYSKKELIKQEYEVFGFYINNSPIIEYRKELKIEKTLSNLSSFRKRVTTFIVCIDYIKEITNKNNEKMAFIKFSDEFTSAEGVIFADAYKDVPKIKNNSIVKLIGKVALRDGKDQIIVNKLEIINE